MPNTVQGFDFHFNQTPHNKSQYILYISKHGYGIEKAFFHRHRRRPLCLSASRSLVYSSSRHRVGRDAHIILPHEAIDISFFLCCVFGVFCSSLSLSLRSLSLSRCVCCLSCLLFPLNFRQPPPTYFIARTKYYIKVSGLCALANAHTKKMRPLYPRAKYIKCPESFQSYQMHRTNLNC